jgi:hypothetical protein
MLSGDESPIKQGFPVRTPGSATATVLAARTFTNSGRTAHSPGTNTLKEVDDTKVSSCEGFGVAIAVAKKIRY